MWKNMLRWMCVVTKLDGEIIDKSWRNIKKVQESRLKSYRHCNKMRSEEHVGERNVDGDARPGREGKEDRSDVDGSFWKASSMT